jgi:hypothetical protein
MSFSPIPLHTGVQRSTFSPTPQGTATADDVTPRSDATIMCLCFMKTWSAGSEVSERLPPVKTRPLVFFQNGSRECKDFVSPFLPLFLCACVSRLVQTHLLGADQPNLLHCNDVYSTCSKPVLRTLLIDASHPFARSIEERASSLTTRHEVPA